MTRRDMTSDGDSFFEWPVAGAGGRWPGAVGGACEVTVGSGRWPEPVAGGRWQDGGVESRWPLAGGRWPGGGVDSSFLHHHHQRQDQQSSQVMSRPVMLRHVLSSTRVVSRWVRLLASRVGACPVASRHVVSCHVASCMVTFIIFLTRVVEEQSLTRDDDKSR